MSRFITFHVLNQLGLHNLNRDQNGLPKSHFDGGVQRARLSSQSLKRAARVAYREAVAGDVGVRTRAAVDRTLSLARSYAETKGVEIDEERVEKVVTEVVKKLTNSKKNDDKKAEKAKDAGKEVDEKATVLFLTEAEMATLARTVVDLGDADVNDLVAGDFTSSLDIAAFGRMFANQNQLTTRAAVAVSHAVTTHPMALVSDYFSAVDDLVTGKGAAHLGTAFFTSGVYYRTFTIDRDQLHLSWTGTDTDTGRDELKALIRACLEALPSGKTNSTNAVTLPATVVVEQTRQRFVYSFDEPVEAGDDGGHLVPSVAALVRARKQAEAYDSSLWTGETLLLGETGEFPGRRVDGVDDLMDAVVAAVLDKTALS